MRWISTYCHSGSPCIGGVDRGLGLGQGNHSDLPQFCLSVYAHFVTIVKMVNQSVEVRSKGEIWRRMLREESRKVDCTLQNR